MIYKKKVSTGTWLKKGEDFKNGDFAIIANEGQEIEGQFGIQNVFLVKLENGKEGNVAINQTSINTLIDGYGEDSINWIGKKVKIEMIRQNVQGKITPVYYFLHPDAELDEQSGQFILGKKTTDSQEISPDEVPF